MFFLWFNSDFNGSKSVSATRPVDFYLKTVDYRWMAFSFRLRTVYYDFLEAGPAANWHH